MIGHSSEVTCGARQHAYTPLSKVGSRRALDEATRINCTEQRGLCVLYVARRPFSRSGADARSFGIEETIARSVEYRAMLLL